MGRFNGGQKMNARLALAGLTGLYVTGVYLLTFGRSAFGHLHGPFAFLTTALVVGHIFMAVVNPSTRHALRGMTLGSVDRDWAAHHFPRWVEEMDRQQEADGRPGPRSRRLESARPCIPGREFERGAATRPVERYTKLGSGQPARTADPVASLRPDGSQGAES